MRKPYYSKSRKRWFVRQGSTQTNLGSNKKEAFQKYYQLMAGQKEANPDVLVADIVAEFLDWSQVHQAESTYKNYVYWIQSFGASVQRMRVKDLKPYHVARWLDARGYTGNTANGAVRAVMRAFNWAVKMGVIADNPVKGVERPAAMPRECYITPQQFDRLLAAIRDEPFRDFVTFLRETGCRPLEARSAEARHFDRTGQTLAFPREESKGKKRQRVIVLTPKALEIVQRLALKYPAGPLFRNRRGKRWTRDALNNRFSRLSEKLEFQCYPYAIRHTWVTDALLNGVEPLTVATLAGHSSIKMIWEVYNKISLQKDHMRKAAIQAAERKQA